MREPDFLQAACHGGEMPAIWGARVAGVVELGLKTKAYGQSYARYDTVGLLGSLLFGLVDQGCNHQIAANI